MTNYRLVFAPSRDGVALRTLEAEDAGTALALAHRHANGRPAELWRGEKLLCQISEDSAAGFWTIA